MSLTRAAMIRRAFNLAGVMAPSGQYQDGDYDMAVDLLTTDLDSLQEHGVVLQNTDRATLAIVAGTKEYTLPSTVLNVVIGPDSVAGTIVNSDNYEAPVRALSRHEYTTGVLSKESESTQSTHVYVEKTGTTVKLVFWPEPTSAATFRYQSITLNETMETYRRWQKAIMWTLAGSIARAKSKPLQDVQSLEDRADQEIRKAKSSDQELGPAQFYVPRMWGR